MKADYSVSTAKSMVTRNGGKFEGKAIIIQQPGIKVLGAIDFLKVNGYYWNKGLVEKPIKEFDGSLNSFNEVLNKAREALKQFKKLMSGEDA